MAACEKHVNRTADCISVSIEAPGCGIAEMNRLWAEALQQVRDFIGPECPINTSQAPGAWTASGCKCKKAGGSKGSAKKLKAKPKPKRR